MYPNIYHLRRRRLKNHRMPPSVLHAAGGTSCVAVDRAAGGRTCPADCSNEVLGNEIVHATSIHGHSFKVQVDGFRATAIKATKTWFAPPDDTLLPEGFTHLLRERGVGGPTWKLIDKRSRRESVPPVSTALRYLYVKEA